MLQLTAFVAAGRSRKGSYRGRLQLATCFVSAPKVDDLRAASLLQIMGKLMNERTFSKAQTNTFAKLKRNNFASQVRRVRSLAKQRAFV